MSKSYVCCSNLGCVIKKIRKQRGLTQKALGVALGFPEATADIRISQYESGSRKPKKELLDRISIVLGCEIRVVEYIAYSFNEDPLK